MIGTDPICFTTGTRYSFRFSLPHLGHDIPTSSVALARDSCKRQLGGRQAEHRGPWHQAAYLAGAIIKYGTLRTACHEHSLIVLSMSSDAPWSPTCRLSTLPERAS